MHQTAGSRSGLLRATVCSGTRRVDLVLPAAVPLAELVPELARSVGLLDARAVHGGYRVVTSGGRELATEAGLTAQGVTDGALLTVSAGVDLPPARVYDDVVEAMADAVRRDLRPWSSASARTTTLTAAGLLFALSVAALSTQWSSPLAGATATAVAVVLVGGSVVLARAGREPHAALALAWAGCAHAALAGSVLAPGHGPPASGMPVTCAGAGALVAGLVCVVGLDAGRALVLPAVVGGAVAAGVGLLEQVGSPDTATVLTVVLVGVVLAGSASPRLALAAAGTTVDHPTGPGDHAVALVGADAVRAGADARAAREILLATSATFGLLLVAVAPLAVGLGAAGTLVAVVSCLTVVLRTRRHRAAPDVLVGLGSGVLGLVSTSAAVLWLHAAWRPGLAVGLAATAALLLAVTAVPAGPSVRRARLADLAETACLLSLAPLAVLAAGVHSVVRT